MLCQWAPATARLLLWRPCGGTGGEVRAGTRLAGDGEIGKLCSVGQVGWSSEHPGLGEDVPGHGRGVGTR